MAEVAPFRALLLGLIVGSFLNVLILRDPAQAYARANSPKPAPTCATSRPEPLTNRLFGLDYLITPPRPATLRPRDPRLGEHPGARYLLLRGAAATARAQISIRLPAGGGGTGLLSLGVVLHFGATPAALAALVLFGAWLLTHGNRPRRTVAADQLTLPLLWLGLLVNIDGTCSSI